MNVYLKSKTARSLKKQIAFFNNQVDCNFNESLDLHLIINRKIGLFEVFTITQKFKKVNSFEIIASPKHISKPLISFVNSNSNLGVLFLINKPLSKNDFKKINRYGGTVKIIDNTNLVKQEQFNSNKFLIQNQNENGFLNADAYILTAKPNPIYQCIFSSCLGHTLYVDCENNVSFCPKYPEKSKLGKLKEFNDLFDNTNFYNCIKQSVEKRAQCKKSCEHFEKCKGGCPFEDNCNQFKTLYDNAIKNLNNVCENNSDITALPLYKQRALLTKLCSKDNKR